MMIMEKISHKLGDQRLPPDIDEAKALMICCGRMHAHFWGGNKGKHPKVSVVTNKTGLELFIKRQLLTPPTTPLPYTTGKSAKRSR